MPRVRYTGGGGYHIRDGPDFGEAGDEADVGERTAERLAQRADFELLDGDGSEGVADGEVNETALEETPTTDEATDDTFDAEAWLEQGYRTRANRVADGEVDEHLKAIDDAETSETVKDAVDERREVAE